MKRGTIFFGLLYLAGLAQAEVQVFVEEVSGTARIQYRCTVGEVVRAFALDVTVDQGQIVGISDFFVGESTALAQGYGIFPASFRDHITLGLETNINWDVSGYTPLAVATDDPMGTLPGLNSSGVTLEMAALWDPTDLAAIPSSEGILCGLHLSEPAYVSVAANTSRGGIISALSDVVLATEFTGCFVHPPNPEVAVTGLKLLDGVLTITFMGGELESAFTIDGEWTGTGSFSGEYTESVGGKQAKFYRVRGQ